MDVFATMNRREQSSSFLHAVIEIGKKIFNRGRKGAYLFIPRGNKGSDILQIGAQKRQTYKV